MSNFVSFIATRLKETSTRVTIGTIVAGLVGAHVSPENKEVIATAVAGVLALIAAFWGSDKPTA